MNLKKIFGKVVVVNDLEDLFKYMNKLIVPEVVIFENEEYKAEFIDSKYYLQVTLKRIKDLGLRKVREIDICKDHYAITTKIGYHYHNNGKSNFFLDRENGPALIRRFLGNFNISQEMFWEKDNKLHRTNGPAYILYDAEYEIIETKWCIDDRELNEFEIEVMKASNEVE